MNQFPYKISAASFHTAIGLPNVMASLLRQGNRVDTGFVGLCVRLAARRRQATMKPEIA